MISRSDHPFIEAVSRLAYCNPFLPERIEHEQAALGPAFAEGGQPWNVHPDRAILDVNLTRLFGHMHVEGEGMTPGIGGKFTELRACHGTNTVRCQADVYERIGHVPLC